MSRIAEATNFLATAQKLCVTSAMVKEIERREQDLAAACVDLNDCLSEAIAALVDPQDGLLFLALVRAELAKLQQEWVLRLEAEQ